VIWGFQERQKLFDPKTQCGKMISVCRDIFSTDGIDEFGHGASPIGNHAQSTAIAVALCAGLIASALVLYTLRGGFPKDNNGDIQFTRVSNEEALTL
jgi:hypothetical protein